MKHITSVILLILLATGLVAPQAGSANQVETPTAILGTAFTYQGRLAQAGSPANGYFDFRFILYDAAAGGNQVGNILEIFNQLVSDGYFTVKLDFGAAFAGSARWLEVAVKAAGAGTYTSLSPRQELTAAPNALYASSAPWNGLAGLPAGFADGVDNDTTYLAGAGLTLGGNTFSADTSYLQRRVSGNCAAGNAIRVVNQDGTVTCEADDNTTYSAGTGLTLSGTTFNVDTTYLQQRVSGNCAAGNAIRVVNQDGTVTCEADDNTTYSAGTGLTLSGTTFNADTSYLQRRVSGACAVGSTIRAILADGKVECQLDAPLRRAAPPDGNKFYTLDSTGYVGDYTSTTIGADGLGLISYRDSTNGDLKVAHCNDAACSSASTYTLDSTGDVGSYTSITIAAKGRGLISYLDSTNLDLKVAHCNNTACSSASIYTLDSNGDVGLFTSITIGADGLGLISYYDFTNGNLKVAHCSNDPCSSASIYTLDSAGDVGWWTSITTGVDGFGLISYYDYTNYDLKVAHCSDLYCTRASTYTLDTAGNVGEYTSITTGVDGFGLISYFDVINADLKVAHCSNITCSSATTYTLNSTGDVGRYTSITIGTDGLGLISYYDLSYGYLKVAHCANVECSTANIRTLESAYDVGMYSSITIGTDGLPLIASQDLTNDDMTVYHCSNAFCVNFFRRR